MATALKDADDTIDEAPEYDPAEDGLPAPPEGDFEEVVEDTAWMEEEQDWMKIPDEIKLDDIVTDGPEYEPDEYDDWVCSSTLEPACKDPTFFVPDINACWDKGNEK